MYRNKPNIKWLFRLYLLGYYILESSANHETATYGVMGPVYYMLKCLSEPHHALCNKIFSLGDIMSECGAELILNTTIYSSSVSKHLLFSDERDIQRSSLELTLYGTKSLNCSIEILNFTDCIITHLLDYDVAKLKKDALPIGFLFLGLFSIVLLFSCLGLSQKYIGRLYSYVRSEHYTIEHYDAGDNVTENVKLDELQIAQVIELEPEEPTKKLVDLVSTVISGCEEKRYPKERISKLLEGAQSGQVDFYEKYEEAGDATATKIYDALHKIGRIYGHQTIFAQNTTINVFDSDITPFAETVGEINQQTRLRYNKIIQNVLDEKLKDYSDFIDSSTRMMTP